MVVEVVVVVGGWWRKWWLLSMDGGETGGGASLWASAISKTAVTASCSGTLMWTKRDRLLSNCCVLFIVVS